jgi:alcohol dehydrogenase class IV
MDPVGEIFRPAFPQERDIEGNLLYQHVSHGLTYDVSCAMHIRETYLSKTSHVRSLEQALGSNHLATWVGIRPHTPWEDLVPIINDMRQKQADCLVTIGGGSLTDGAKVIILVCDLVRAFGYMRLISRQGSYKRCPYTLRPRSSNREETS